MSTSEERCPVDFDLQIRRLRGDGLVHGIVCCVKEKLQRMFIITCMQLTRSNNDG